MTKRPFLKKNGIFFAPLEGVTDESYRLALLKTFPEWDNISTDFFRIPSVGRTTKRSLIEHFGEQAYQMPEHLSKTTFQILTSTKGPIPETVELIAELGFEHLDLNLGCPSKTVNGNMGGAYLLKDLAPLRDLIRVIRQSFPHTFTAKMRIGYHDDFLFSETLKLLEDEGVDAITLHARTRDQLYQGQANWNYIKQAAEQLSIPLIGNGDIWGHEDIDHIFKQTGCHGVMLGRSAMKTPWMPLWSREYQNGTLNEAALLFQRTAFIQEYFLNLENEFRSKHLPDRTILKRFKSMIYHIFEDYPQGEEIRSRCLRSESLSEFKDYLYQLA